MLVRLNSTHFIKADNIDEMEIDTLHNRVKVTSHQGGVRTIEPEHGETLEAIAGAIEAQVNGPRPSYNLFEAQTW